MLSVSLIFFILVYKYLYYSRELHENNQCINSTINVEKTFCKFWQFILKHFGHARACLTTSPKNVTDQNVASLAVKLHEKCEIYTSNSSQHIKNLRSLQTDWPNAFSPTIREPGFTGKRFLAESQRQLCCII